MQATLSELANLVDGILVGDGDLVIHGAASLRDAVAGRNHPGRRKRQAARFVRVPGDRSDRAQGIHPGNHAGHPGRRRASGVRGHHPPFPSAAPGPAASASARWPRSSAPRPGSAHNVDIHPLRHHRRRRGDRRRLDDPRRASTSWPARRSARDVTIFPNAVLYENTIVGTAVRDPRRRRARGLRVRLRLRRRPPRAFGPVGQRGARGRRRDRRRHAPSTAAPTARRSSARAPRSTTW